MNSESLSALNRCAFLTVGGLPVVVVAIFLAVVAVAGFVVVCRRKPSLLAFLGVMWAGVLALALLVSVLQADIAAAAIVRDTKDVVASPGWKVDWVRLQDGEPHAAKISSADSTGSIQIAGEIKPTTIPGLSVVIGRDIISALTVGEGHANLFKSSPLEPKVTHYTISGL